MSSHHLSKILTVAATALSVGLATSSAFAQETFAGEPAIGEGTRGPRFRFGIGNVNGVAWQRKAEAADRPARNVDVFLLGLAIRGGVQINDHYAVFHQTSLSAVFSNFRNSAMFEFTPVDYFSVGAGISMDYYFQSVQHHSPSWSIGAPVRLALNIPVARSNSGARVGMSLNVDLTPAYNTGDADRPPGFQLGAMAGLSFEVF